MPITGSPRTSHAVVALLVAVSLISCARPRADAPAQGQLSTAQSDQPVSSAEPEEKDTIYIFPFRTALNDSIAGAEHPQAPFAIGYPSFLATLFSSIEELEVREDYANMVTLDADRQNMGVSNFSIDALAAAVEMNGDPLIGYGVTGFIEIVPMGGSRIGVTIFDMESLEVVRESQFRPAFGMEINALLGDAITDIVYGATLEDYFVGRTMELHDSLARTNNGFLAYLELLGLVNLSASGVPVEPELMLSAAERGFRAQPTFYVLELMFLDLIRYELPAGVYDQAISSIDRLVVPESAEYLAYRADDGLGEN
jgi:hypothetical protein